MTTTSDPLDLVFPELFFDIRGFLRRGKVIAKLEGFNVTGSIKIKAAVAMVNDMEIRGLLERGKSTVVESSSGNLGVALALVCNLRGYRFICVTDPNISHANSRAIRAYGAELVVVTERDEKGGYLQTRLKTVDALLHTHPQAVWLNQYGNPANRQAHAETTAREVLENVPDVTHLYVGAGTTGTLMGIAQHFAEHAPHVRITAVEPTGSVTFDPSQTGRRLIPGIGTSVKPPLADATKVNDVTYVDELDTIHMCHRLARHHGLLLGGSSGSVMCAIERDQETFTSDATIVAISPDLGDKYLETIYCPDWLAKHFSEDLPPTTNFSSPWM